MIAFDLLCTQGHRFEGWFASSGAYDVQANSGLIACPSCGDHAISKALTAPYIGRKSNQAVTVPSPASSQSAAPAAISNAAEPPAELIAKLAEFQSELLSKSEYVGPQFAENVRSIHYGETEDRLIHGEATPEQSQELRDEGIGIMPLLCPVIAPNSKN